jgi:hypothetical protein
MRESMDTTETRHVCMEGSWGATPRVERTMRLTASINSETRRGCFEVYDVDSGGDEFYGGGGLWLNGNGYLCDYDGVGSLDMGIVEWLDDLGMIDPDSTCFFRKELNKKVSA